MTGVSLDMATANQPDRRTDAAGVPQANCSALWPAIPGGMRMIAWAGYQLLVPEAFEIARVTGDHRRGHFTLSDDDAVRFEIAWDTVRGRRAKAERIVRRHLQRSHKKYNGGQPPEPAELSSENFSPLMHIPDERRKLDRYGGFCEQSRRVFEAVYYHGPTSENRRVQEVTVPQMADQSPDAPQWWAFFGCRFAAPSGLRYARSTLNLGDMLVRLIDGRREATSSQAQVREIYPATLALTRQPLENWAHQWVAEEGRVWRAPRMGLGKLAPVVTTDIDTALGPGIEVSLRMRTPLRLLMWRHPRRATMWLIHNEQRNRLHGLFVAHRDRTQVAPLLDELVAGLIRESNEG